ncbi:Cyclin [Teladorsagia circumcincta]|uniref:Protein CNPPD1 n=1 Tax=Teladorsagia circumcincta TaxID=45464 RepID=A0A2G9TS87_TELCI|nr:Cyclin [Teladorsagia circumcincta]
MAPQFPDFRRVRRRIRRTLCYGSKQPQNVNLPLSELVVDYFNKRSPFDYISPETSASISDRGYADPCTLVVAMVYLDRLRVNDKKWFESSDPTDLYLPALVLASKFLHDSDTYDRASNAEWSEAASISTQHLNQLEWEFVQRLNWNVMVEEAEFNRWLGFFEYWVANDFLAKNGFCTYNEIAQLSSGLPLMAMIQSLVSFFSLMTLVYTFSVVSLFAVPCSLLRADHGIVENSTGKATPVPPFHSSEKVEILITLGDNQHKYWNENGVEIEGISAETSTCDSNSSTLADEANLNVFACGINELGPLWKEAADLCETAIECRLPRVADAIRYSLRNHRSNATFKAYSIKCKKFVQWWGEERVKDLPISKARNLFLAHCIDKSQHISLPTTSAALTFFLGKQKGADKDIETSLLDSAARSRAPVKHRAKISTADYSKIVRLGDSSQDPKAFSIQ